MSYPSAPSSSSSRYPSAPSTSYSSYEPIPPQYHSYVHDAAPPPDLHPHRQPPAPAPSTSSLTPSSSFGSFAVRRVRSSGTLPHLHPSALHPHAAYAQPVYPPSPVSPLYPGGLAAQQTSAPAGWRDGGYPQSSGAAQFAYADDPYQGGGLARLPQTPPPSARKRVASAQPSFATQTPVTRPATSAYTSYPGSAFGVPEAAPMSYSHTTPGGGFPQTSPEEVNQFFQEMSEILGPEALAALSPTSSYAPPPSLGPPPPTVTLQPPPPSKKRATYNVSGVLLDEDDYRAFADSPTTSRQPSPAPAQPFVPPGMIYGAPSDPALPTNGYLAPSQLGVPIDLQRPASAPPTPAAGEPEPMFRFAPYGSPYDTPSASARVTAPMNRRRGSSLDASAIPRMYSSGLVGFAPPPPPHEAPYTPAAGMSPTRPPPVQIHRAHAAPPMSAYPPSFRVAPSHPQQQQRRSPPPSPTRPQTQAQAPPQTPKRAPGGRRSKGSSISFINFSAADSKTLLGGVAPSGSSKKRAREGEGDEGREEKRVAVE